MQVLEKHLSLLAAKALENKSRERKQFNQWPEYFQLLPSNSPSHSPPFLFSPQLNRALWRASLNLFSTVYKVLLLSTDFKNIIPHCKAQPAQCAQLCFSICQNSPARQVTQKTAPGWKCSPVPHKAIWQAGIYRMHLHQQDQSGEKHN